MPLFFRFRRRQQVRFQDRAGVERQAGDGDFRQAIFKADHLALFSHAQAAFQAARRLREQRRVCGRAAATDAAAASVEQRQSDAGFLAGFDQRVLRLILRPAGGHHAGVFRRVGVTDHHHLLALNKAAIPVDAQQLTHDVVSVVEVVEGFKQRRHRHREGDARLFQQQMYSQHVGRRLGHRDYVGGDGALRCFGSDAAGFQHFARFVARLPVARQQRTFGVQLAHQKGLFIRF